ncbi:sodium:solute symporter [Allosphingosinicella deserti]|uniref:Sodium:solute symporter n=1 Tax=Allosphingosinicella deserti TaxID=2116704 RepID=A0A2P7QLB2_9SPHN|nr:sodium:solute symporter [Sphingomonas deserti]PSJ38761.1 sodium:solute symporter [Sphingomonas deserti]
MTGGFTALDWSIVGGYVLLLALAGLLSTRRQRDADDYFLAGHRVPIWLVAVSVLSTTQSAATFLGAPDYSYRGDYTYLASYAGPLLAAWLISRWLIPRLYALRVTTVYELLRHRFDAKAMRAAAGMYLIGRILASGARLYLAAIAVAMIIFGEVDAGNIFLASLALVVVGLAFTFLGGLESIVWTDLVQVLLYTGAALVVLALLRTAIPASNAEILAALTTSAEGGSKLRLIDWSLDASAPFSVVATLTGITLLFFASMGLDQDTTQRLLACRDAREGSRALYLSVLSAIPVVLLFMAIGSLLYIFYGRPDLMGRSAVAAGEFEGETITIFMHYILTELPAGVRGFVAVGILAAAAVNSGLISMASVLIEDFYRPWITRRQDLPASHFVAAGRLGMVALGFALLGMSVLCYHWQHYSDTPLLTFALAVMSFAYSGLLGVFFTALFTRRGSSASVVAALITGFVTILLMQPYVVDVIGLPAGWKALAFPYQLCLGTAVAFATCCAARGINRELGPS